MIVTPGSWAARAGSGGRPTTARCPVFRRHRRGVAKPVGHDPQPAARAWRRAGAAALAVLAARWLAQSFPGLRLRPDVPSPFTVPAQG
jgi:hypothetical protein